MAWDRDKEKKAAKNMNIASCVFGIVFLLVWCSLAPSFMKLFGLFGLAMMVYRLYICIQMGKEDKNKPKDLDPWDRPASSVTPKQESPSSKGFCPYCGGSVQEEFQFCPKCGRRLG